MPVSRRPHYVSGYFEADDTVEFWDITNREDWAISELSQAGIKSRANKPGPYSRCESLPHAFDQMVLDREKAGTQETSLLNGQTPSVILRTRTARQIA